MKIWYQSASSYRYEPVFEDYGRTLEAQCAAVLRPDTKLHVTGIPVMVRDIENWRGLQYFQNIETIRGPGLRCIRHRLHTGRGPCRGQEPAGHPGGWHQRDRLPRGHDAGSHVCRCYQLSGFL